MLPALLPLPFVVLLLTAFVAYGRWRLAPLDGAARNVTSGSSLGA